MLLLCGGVLLLADRRTWAEGRFLAVDLDTALERNDRAQTGELAMIAALFGAETLRRRTARPLLDGLLKASTDNAVGVSGELRDGLQRSVEIIANEVLARLDDAGLEPRDVEDRRIPFARELTRESLRYLYRLLFLLYAEARPELGILPADDEHLRGRLLRGPPARPRRARRAARGRGRTHGLPPLRLAGPAVRQGQQRPPVHADAAAGDDATR